MLFPVLPHALFKSEPPQSVHPPGSWLKDNLFKKITITGRNTLAFHAQTVQGDKDAFNALTYYGQGASRFTQTGQMQIAGRKVLGFLNFQASVADNRFSDPQNQKFSLDYDRGPLQVSALDIQGSLLNTNPLASFSRNQRGAMVTYKSKNFTVRALRSTVKSETKTITVQGDGSAGPYYLQAAQIVHDSEKVILDGRPLQIGVDYTMNYDLGTLTLINRTLGQTSSLAVSFESLDPTQRGGSAQGVSMSYSLGKAGRFGFTTVEQKKSSSNAGAQRTELFQGFGAPSTPYYLQFLPLTTSPILVRVDGLLQVMGIDYFFDAQNGSIFYFRRFIPTTSTVTVIYTPKPTQVVDGDHRAVGIDYTIPIGKDGNLTLYQATGTLSNTPTPSSGIGRGAAAKFNLGKWDVRGSWQDIPQSFVAIQTVGFNRNSRSWMLGLDRQIGAGKLRFEAGNSAISSRSYDAQNNPIYLSDRISYAKVGYDFHFSPKGPTWNFEHIRNNYQGATNQSQVDTTRLSTNLATGKFHSSLDLERLGGTGSFNGGDRISVASNTVRLNGGYELGKSWSLNSKIGVSKTSSNSENATGTDLSIAATYRPKNPFTLDLSYTYSQAGQVAALLGFTNGMNAGYNSGISSPTTSSAFATNAKLFQVLSSYKLSDRANLDARFISNQSTGSLTSNSNSTSMGFGFDWEAFARQRLTVNLDHSTTSFIGSSVASRSTNLDVRMQGPLDRKWSYSAGLNTLLSGGSTYAQNAFALDLSLSRAVAANQRAGVSWRSGNTTGYLPQNDYNLNFFYSYGIWRNLGLTASYHIRKLANLDPNVSAGSYRATGLDLELNFDFAP